MHGTHVSAVVGQSTSSEAGDRDAKGIRTPDADPDIPGLTNIQWVGQ